MYTSISSSLAPWTSVDARKQDFSRIAPLTSLILERAIQHQVILFSLYYGEGNMITWIHADEPSLSSLRHCSSCVACRHKKELRGKAGSVLSPPSRGLTAKTNDRDSRFASGEGGM